MICPQFLPEFPRDLAFPAKILQGVREEKLQLKDPWIFSQTVT